MTSLLCRAAAATAVCATLATGPAFAQIPELSADDVKSTRPTPRTASGKPDFSGYWKGMKDTKPEATSARICPAGSSPSRRQARQRSNAT
jgi:hypothetical protein